MSYEVIDGVALEENDPSDESKIPQTASDLRWPEITLEYRQCYLDKIRKMSNVIQQLESQYIIPDENGSIGDSMKTIDLIMRRCDYANLKSTCENGTCALGPEIKISIYENYCSVCRDSKSLNPVQNRLSIIRNIKMRISFLEFQLASSLANQLTQDELYSNLRECDKWAKLVLV